MRSHFLWLCFLLVTFVITLPVTWWGMAKADFFYPSLYEGIGIDRHIEVYAPRNMFKKLEFEKTTKEEQVELFRGVVTAIHNEGKGLSDLSYVQPSTQKTIQLFTEAEVIHLQDVAILLDKLKPIVISFVIFWFILMVWVFVRRVKLPSLKQFSIYTLTWLVLVGLVLATGPEAVFNQLHIWVFPSDHQWYFYYEESLMSTMMKAPNLFAYIAAIWGAFSIGLTILLLKVVHLIQVDKR